MDQPIGGLQSNFVELHGGIGHARARFGIEFQPVVVRRCDRKRADFSELLEHRPRQRRALSGFGTAADFIEENERTGCRRLDHRLDRQNVRRKSAQVIRDRLLIADIGQHVIEYRQSCFLGWNGNSRLRHQRKQARRLQYNRFPSRIWPADDQNAATGDPYRVTPVSSICSRAADCLQAADAAL